MNDRLLNVSLLIFDLPTLIEKVRHEQNWGKSELKAMILLKKRDKQLVLKALHEKTKNIFSKSNDSIAFKIIVSDPKRIFTS